MFESHGLAVIEEIQSFDATIAGSTTRHARTWKRLLCSMICCGPEHNDKQAATPFATRMSANP